MTTPAPTGPWFVELLARNGEVLQRQRLERLPIRIGRGYGNDVILDDDYAAPSHAIVEPDAAGQPVLRDLGTQNGVNLNGRRLHEVALGGDTVVRIGHTALRLRPANHPVPAALPDRTFHGWEGVLPGVAGCALAGLAALFVRWISDTEYVEYVRYGAALAMGIGAALLWSGAWAFANRLFARHARLGRHLFVAGCGMVALLACGLGAATLGYALSAESFTHYASHAGMALVAAIIYCHLCTIRPQARARYRWICAALAVLGSSLILTANVQRTGRFSDELYMATLLPPALRASPDRGIDEFMRDAEAMKPGLDRGRGRKPGEDAIDD